MWNRTKPTRTGSPNTGCRGLVYGLVRVVTRPCTGLSATDETKAMLKSEFEIKDLGASKRLLGMDIRRDRSKGKLWLSQSQYIEKVLHQFHMSQAKPVSTPLAAHFKLSTSSGPLDVEEERYMSRVPYACAAGNLMYAMVCTRPDIAHAVSVVSRFMLKPGKEYWKAVQWILSYLRGTSKYDVSV